MRNRNKRQSPNTSNGKRRKALISGLILSLMVFSLIPHSVEAAPGDFVVFRAEISTMYIENTSPAMRFYALVFQDNKPTAETSEIHIKVEGINLNYSYTATTRTETGRPLTYYLPPLKQGHYKATLYAESQGVKSEVVAQDFGVSKPPIPYKIYFNQDGSRFYFQTEKLDKQGRPDSNFTFRIEIYYYQHGAGESLVRTYTNITNATFTIPEQYRNGGGIITIDIIDRWQWRNSATMDINNLQFQGIPAMYDYGYLQREPAQSANIVNFLAYAIALLVILYIANKLIGGGTNAKE